MKLKLIAGSTIANEPLPSDRSASTKLSLVVKSSPAAEGSAHCRVDSSIFATEQISSAKAFYETR